VARRGTVGALLGSGLVAVTALGGAGGYGVGLLTAVERSAASSGAAAPLGEIQPSTPSSTPSPTPTPRKIKPDNTPALDASDLSYKTRTFTVKSMVKSQISVRVPANWGLTQPDPPKTGRFTDPTGKRWIRIEAGFTISRPPSASMAARIADLKHLSPDQMVQIISDTVDATYATLVYSNGSLRHRPLGRRRQRQLRRRDELHRPAPGQGRPDGGPRQGHHQRRTTRQPALTRRTGDRSAKVDLSTRPAPSGAFESHGVTPCAEWLESLCHKGF
jgi:hypothetical protein